MSAAPGGSDPLATRADVASTTGRVESSFAAMLRTEMRLFMRHGVVATAFVSTVAWAGVLAVVPHGVRVEVMAWVLFMDVAALGFFFIPALEAMERTSGVTAALMMTPLRRSTAVVVRVGLVAGLVVPCAAALAVVAGSTQVMNVAGAAAPLSVLFTLLGLAMMKNATTLTAYFGRVPGVAVPLLVPAIADGLRVLDSNWLVLSPATAGLRLVGGAGGLVEVAVLVLSIAALWVFVLRSGFDPVAATIGRQMRRKLLRAHGPAWRALMSADARTLAGDRILTLVLAGIPTLVLALWLGEGLLTSQLMDTYGVVLDRRLLWGFVLVAHTPIMVGSVCGLLLAEDRDAGLLPAFAVSNGGIRTLLVYRLSGAVVTTGLAVGLGLVLARFENWVGVAATAAAITPVPAMFIAAVARDRGQAVAVMKLMALPFYLPLIAWSVPHIWALGAVPTWWALRALWEPVPNPWWTLGGWIVAAAWTFVFVRRFERSLLVSGSSRSATRPSRRSLRGRSPVRSGQS